MSEELLSTIFTAEERKPKQYKLRVPNKKSDSASSNWKEMAKELEAQGLYFHPNNNNLEAYLYSVEKKKLCDWHFIFPFYFFLDEARAKKSDEKSTSTLTQLDDKDLATFPHGLPLTDTPEYLVCNNCKRPILKIIATTHIKSCLKAKADKKADKAKERKKAKEEAAARLALEKEIESKEADVKDVVGNELGDKDEIKKTAKKTAKNTKAGAKTKKKDDLGDEEKLPKNSKKRKATEGNIYTTMGGYSIPYFLASFSFY